MQRALVPPGGHVWGGRGAPERGLLCFPHHSLFLPLQRERLKNIERICCLLRKVSVRAGGRKLLAMCFLHVLWAALIHAVSWERVVGQRHFGLGLMVGCSSPLLLSVHLKLGSALLQGHSPLILTPPAGGSGVLYPWPLLSDVSVCSRVGNPGPQHPPPLLPPLEVRARATSGEARLGRSAA